MARQPTPGTKGDVFSIANVNQVNPMTRRYITQVPKQFVIISPIVLAGGGNAKPMCFRSARQFSCLVASIKTWMLDRQMAQPLRCSQVPRAPNGKSGANALAIP